MDPCVERAIAERARQQLGLITDHHFASIGGTRKQKRVRLEDGRLIRESPQVLRHHAFPVTWPQQVLGSVLQAGPGSGASDMAAAAVWGFDGIGTGAVEVLVPRDRRPRYVKGLVHRREGVIPADLQLGHLIPRTSPVRTICDIADRLGPRLLQQAVDSAARDGLIVPEALRARALQLLPHRPALATLLEMLEDLPAIASTESWLESRGLRIYRAAGIPLPRTQVVFDRRDGRVARVDCYWDLARLVAELMGHRTHSTRDQRRADAERRAELALQGLEVIEFTYEHVRYQPDYVSATTAAHLAMRLGGGLAATA
jgi:very-short-patch-repair endonuclease